MPQASIATADQAEAAAASTPFAAQVAVFAADQAAAAAAHANAGADGDPAGSTNSDAMLLADEIGRASSCLHAVQVAQRRATAAAASQ